MAAADSSTREASGPAPEHPFAMSDEQLGRLFDQIPVLAGTPRELEDLSGGLTNRNVKVTTPDGVYVARCTDLNADALGIDRDVEHANSVAAEQAGVGAPVLDYRPDLGVLVIAFLDGVTLSRASFTEPHLVQRVAAGCRILHEGPTFRGRFDMYERQAGYLRTVRERGFRTPDGYDDLAGPAARVREALAVRDEGLVPCHNDLLAENFVDDGEKLWLIDYEYSGMNDACFELGNIWTECHLSLDQLDELVNTYYDRSRPSRLARARLLGAVGQWGWTLWGAIQHAVSPMDFDFWQWATERYETACRELTGPELDRLLDDATRQDA